MTHYNLIIIHVPGRQQRADFDSIRNMMYGPADDIDLFILSADQPAPPDFWRRMAERPSLIFSAMPIRLDPKLRGFRAMPPEIARSEEIRLLAEAGFAAPATRTLTPDLRLDEADWGPFTVLKPDGRSRGRGVVLTRTRNVRWLDTAALPESDPRRGRVLLAQRYVPAGARLASYRVMTVLGRVIYAVSATAADDLPPLDPIDIPLNAQATRPSLALTEDAEVLTLARAVAAKLAHLPVLGIDIIREAQTGKLHVFDLNAGGNAWHLSSDHGLAQQRRFGLDYFSQFDALPTIAAALAEATRRLAV